MKIKPINNLIVIGVAFLLVFSVSLSLWQSYQFEKLLESGSVVYLCNISDPSSPPFITLKDKYSPEDSTKYFKVVKKVTNSIDFDFAAINEPSGFELMAVGSTTDSNLIRVYIYRNSPTLSQPRQEFHWIWKGFLTKSKCN